ncbi:MAG: hypothetical protein NW215_00400 [Hyphomicrobiales bacterium]|nr:hypothetical protein [Hyphomicrobiales bacterium]
MSKPRKSLSALLSGDVEATVNAPREKLRVQVAAERPRNVHVKSSLYLDPAVHRVLQEIAFEQRVRIHDLFLDGIDLLLRELGQRSISEIIAQSRKAS